MMSKSIYLLLVLGFSICTFASWEAISPQGGYTPNKEIPSNILELNGTFKGKGNRKEQDEYKYRNIYVYNIKENGSPSGRYNILFFTEDYLHLLITRGTYRGPNQIELSPILFDPDKSYIQIGRFERPIYLYILKNSKSKPYLALRGFSDHDLNFDEPNDDLKIQAFGSSHFYSNKENSLEIVNQNKFSIEAYLSSEFLDSFQGRITFDFQVDGLLVGKMDSHNSRYSYPIFGLLIKDGRREKFLLTYISKSATHTLTVLDKQ